MNFLFDIESIAIKFCAIADFYNITYIDAHLFFVIASDFFKSQSLQTFIMNARNNDIDCDLVGKINIDINKH